MQSRVMLKRKSPCRCGFPLIRACHLPKSDSGKTLVNNVLIGQLVSLYHFGRLMPRSKIFKVSERQHQILFATQIFTIGRDNHN